MARNKVQFQKSMILSWFNHRFNLESMIMELVRIGCRTAPMPQRLLKLAESRW